MRNGLNNCQENQKQSHETILQEIALGDKTAINDCLNTYEKKIWRFCRKFLKNQQDAEDLMQEIFLDIWKSSAHFNPAFSPEWVFIKMIAKRRLIDSLRKHYRQPQIVSWEQIAEEKTNNSQSTMQINLEIQSILIAINKLTSTDQEIMRLSYYEGMSHKEIAQSINLPIGTVKTRILRSLKKIRISLNFTLPEAAVR